jgi:uncharacterized membrane protein
LGGSITGSPNQPTEVGMIGALISLVAVVLWLIWIIWTLVLMTEIKFQVTRSAHTLEAIRQQGEILDLT